MKFIETVRIFQWISEVTPDLNKQRELFRLKLIIHSIQRGQMIPHYPLLLDKHVIDRDHGC